MKKNEFKEGDLVAFRKFGAEWGTDIYGKVIACFGDYTVVRFHSKINEEYVDIHTIRVREINVGLVHTEYLSLTSFVPLQFKYEFPESLLDFPINFFDLLE